MDFDILKICISCSEEKMCSFTVNPFIEEVYPEEENEEEYWCEDCHHEACMDI